MCILILDFANVVNHPVHILTKNNQMSPSAFIPFCEFGGDMNVMGVKTSDFEEPVCNSFQEKILNDQLCYEVDLNRFSHKLNIDKYLKLGLNLIMDYNEDRQVTFEKLGAKEEERSVAIKASKSDDSQHAFIYLGTVGKYKVCC